MSTDMRLQSLKNRLEKAKSNKIRDAAMKDNALDTMKSSFNIESKEDAEALLKKYRARLEKFEIRLESSVRDFREKYDGKI